MTEKKAKRELDMQEIDSVISCATKIIGLLNRCKKDLQSDYESVLYEKVVAYNTILAMDHFLQGHQKTNSNSVLLGALISKPDFVLNERSRTGIDVTHPIFITPESEKSSDSGCGDYMKKLLKDFGVNETRTPKTH